ncbi:MAG: alpha/beta hydrolase [Ferruginibacter sp.]
MGHSLGGPMVVKLAADDPTLFSTIVIVAGALDINQEAKETWRKIMNVSRCTGYCPEHLGQAILNYFILKKIYCLCKMILTNITCKVLFVHGDADTWVPIKNIAFGQKMMVNAASITADTLHGADHQIPWKRHDELKNILLNLY